MILIQKLDTILSYYLPSYIIIYTSYTNQLLYYDTN